MEPVVAVVEDVVVGGGGGGVARAGREERLARRGRGRGMRPGSGTGTLDRHAWGAGAAWGDVGGCCGFLGGAGRGAEDVGAELRGGDVGGEGGGGEVGEEGCAVFCLLGGLGLVWMLRLWGFPARGVGCGLHAVVAVEDAVEERVGGVAGRVVAGGG